MTDRPPVVLVQSALRRVAGGCVALYGEHWLDRGQRVSPALAPAFHSACTAGHITIAAPDLTQAGIRRAELSPAGWEHYRALEAQSAAAPGPRVDQHGGEKSP